MNSPAAKPGQQGLAAKVVRGGAWIYGRMIVTNVVNIGVMAILARQLKPAEFGIVALATVIMRFLVILGAEGVSEFVIYDNKEGKEERAKAAFWMDLTFATAAMLVGMLLSPFIVAFYCEPSLGLILLFLLIKFPLETSSKVPDALLKKGLDFQRLMIRDTILEILISVTMVLMALSGFGVWSLIVPGFVAAPVRTLIVFWMARWLPGLNFHFRQWRKIFKYSANVIGGTLTSFLLTEGDTLLIGKILGSELLGLYNLAYQAVNIVPRNITAVANRLALPALSMISENADKLREAVARMQRVLALLSFPLLIGLFVLADSFVLTLYGKQWEEAVLPLRIMIVFALRYSVGGVGSALWKALGRTDISFKLGLATIPFYFSAIWLGSHYGIAGVALAITVVRTAFGLIGFEIMGRCMKQTFYQIIRPMLPALFASCIMGGSVFLYLLVAEPLLKNLVPAILVSASFFGAQFSFCFSEVRSETMPGNCPG